MFKKKFLFFIFLIPQYSQAMWGSYGFHDMFNPTLYLTCGHQGFHTPKDTQHLDLTRISTKTTYNKGPKGIGGKRELQPYHHYEAKWKPYDSEPAPLTQLPPELDQLPYLESIDASPCYKSRISTCPILHDDYQGNRLETSQPVLLKLQNLKTLNLAYCHLEGIPPQLSELRKLRVLNLSGNKGIRGNFYAPSRYLSEIDLTGTSLSRIFIPNQSAPKTTYGEVRSIYISLPDGIKEVHIPSKAIIRGQKYPSIDWTSGIPESKQYFKGNYAFYNHQDLFSINGEDIHHDENWRTIISLFMISNTPDRRIGKMDIGTCFVFDTVNDYLSSFGIAPHQTLFEILGRKNYRDERNPLQIHFLEDSASQNEQALRDILNTTIKNYVHPYPDVPEFTLVHSD